MRLPLGLDKRRTKIMPPDGLLHLRQPSACVPGVIGTEPHAITARGDLLQV